MKKVKRKRLPAKSKADQPVAQTSLATDFRSWIGIAAKGPANPNPRFTTEDQLWDKDAD
jgi:hypothetical protein